MKAAALFTILLAAGLAIFAHGCHAQDEDICQRQPATWAHLWPFGAFAYFLLPRKQKSEVRDQRSEIRDQKSEAIQPDF